MSDYDESQLYLPSVSLRNGEEIPCSALGTYGLTESNMVDLLSKYQFQKVLIDTAYKYNNEKYISNALKKCNWKRNNFYLIGKICYEQQKNGNVRTELINTLHNLDVKWIDIYLIHSPRYPLFVKTWCALVELQSEGLIKHIGVSNFNVEQIDELYKATNIYPSVNQIIYNDETRHNMGTIVKYCRSNNIIIQAAMPFGGSNRKNCFNSLERRKILRGLYKENVISIVGTKNYEHMLENFYNFI